MRFKDLKLPKEFSKKKKLKFYKCFIVSNLNDNVTLTVKCDKDRVALSEREAYQQELNAMGREEAETYLFSPQSRKDVIVIFEFEMRNGIMSEDVIIPPNPEFEMDTSPDHDMKFGLMNVTIGKRYDNIHIRYKTLNDICYEIDEATDQLLITQISFNDIPASGKEI